MLSRGDAPGDDALAARAALPFTRRRFSVFFLTEVPHSLARLRRRRCETPVPGAKALPAESTNH